MNFQGKSGLLEADAVSGMCIEGKHSPSPSPESAMPTRSKSVVHPTRSKCVQVEHEMTVSSDELDRKIQSHLEAKATEWYKF